MTLSSYRLGLFAFATAGILLSQTVFAAEALPPVDIEPVDIETVAKLDAVPDRIAATPNGHIFVSIPEAPEPSSRLSQINTGKIYPTPIAWQLRNVRALTSDVQNRMWFLFNYAHTQPESYRAALFAYDAVKQRVAFNMSLVTPLIGESYDLDMVVDAKRDIAYIADFANPSPAIVVIDLKTKTAWRAFEGQLPKMGKTSLALETTGTWLYYGANDDTYIYRLRTGDMHKPGSALVKAKPHIERVGAKPPSNAIAIDKAGRVYVAEKGAGAVGVLRPRETYVRLVEGSALRGRAHDLSFTPDGYLYVTVGAEQKAQTQGRPKPLSYVLRFKPSCGCEATLPPGGFLSPPANF